MTHLHRLCATLLGLGLASACAPTSGDADHHGGGKGDDPTEQGELCPESLIGVNLARLDHRQQLSARAAVGPDGTLYIANGDAIDRLPPCGALESSWVTLPKHADRLAFVTQLVATSDGQLYVTTMSNTMAFPALFRVPAGASAAELVLEDAAGRIFADGARLYLSSQAELPFEGEGDGTVHMLTWFEGDTIAEQDLPGTGASWCDEASDEICIMGVRDGYVYAVIPDADGNRALVRRALDAQGDFEVVRPLRADATGVQLLGDDAWLAIVDSPVEGGEGPAAIITAIGRSEPQVITQTAPATSDALISTVLVGRGALGPSLFVVGAGDDAYPITEFVDWRE